MACETKWSPSACVTPRVIFIVIVNVVALLVLRASPQTEMQPFTLTVAPVAGSFRPHQPIYIRVTEHNESKETIDLSYWDVNGIDMTFQYRVIGPDGSRLAQVLDGTSYPGNPRRRMVKPGASVSIEEPISSLFDFNQTGRYLIQVSRYVGNKAAGPLVSSHILAIDLHN